QASPPSGFPSRFSWTIPQELAAGHYVLGLEVAREFDHNATYSVAAYPAPSVAFGEYGMPYRGQPSVIYTVPIELAGSMTSGTSDSYVGYGDPDGLDGRIRAPDDTITIDIPGSGAKRLGLLPGEAYRIRASAGPDPDGFAPSAPINFTTDPSMTSATISFVAPGDDGF